MKFNYTTITRTEMKLQNFTRSLEKKQNFSPELQSQHQHLLILPN